MYRSYSAYNFLMTTENFSFCQGCLVFLTARHCLVECPSLGDICGQFLSGCQNEDTSFTVSEVLREEVSYKTVVVFSDMLRKLVFFNKLE